MGGSSKQNSSQADNSVTINNVDNSLTEGGAGSAGVLDNLNVVNSTLDSITLNQTDHGAVLGALDVVKTTLGTIDGNNKVNAQLAMDAIDRGNKTAEMAIKGQDGLETDSLMKWGSLSVVAVAVAAVVARKL